ncbi:MAG: 16S rRNA (guanine(527)-N(7))-methyltransferase RsmG [bacterium]
MFHVEQFFKKFFPGLDTHQIILSFSFIEQEYLKWNKVINISSIRDKDGFWEKHVLDSLCLASYLSKNYPGYQIFDVGSGGGFPGLVLAVCLKNEIAMVEPIKKKTDFIDHCILRLKLSNAKTINSKYEAIREAPEKTLVVSRALGNYKALYNHFKSINPKSEFILMTTTEQKHDFRTEYFTEEYDFVNTLTKNSFKNNVLAKITE